MDDLNKLKKFRELTILFAAVFGFGHVLFGIGMGNGYIAPHFGVISWVMMGILIVTIGAKEFETGCPRCNLSGTRPSSDSVSPLGSPIVVLTAAYGLSLKTIFDVPPMLRNRGDLATLS